MSEWIGDFTRNYLVEASAGSGKTYQLVHRLGAALLSGRFLPSQVAAVTFTRKAAAELSGRLRSHLEQVQATQVLTDFDHIFLGTVHSFCARLLRQYPVEAGLGPAFREIEEETDALLQRRCLRRELNTPQGRRLLRLLGEFDGEAIDLYPALAWMSEHGEVDYACPSPEPPESGPVWTALDQLVQDLEPWLGPWEAQATCGLFQLCHRLLRRSHLSRRETPRDLILLLMECETRPQLVKKWWGCNRQDQDANLNRVGSLLENFRQLWIKPTLSQWRAHLYGALVTFLAGVRERCREDRLRRGLVNFHDLLFLTARLLREYPAVRAELAGRYQLLCVDEFQDTDPLQAEIFFLLAACQPGPWTEVKLRPGSLFLVGDPKQSIYRFRRADLQTYLQARQALLESGGECRKLEQSFRTTDSLCQWTNRVFEQLLPAQPTAVQASAQALRPTRPDGNLPWLQVLVQNGGRYGEVSRQEAPQLVAAIQRLCAQGHTPSDFLVLTSRKADLIHYQQALSQAGLPCQVSAEPVPLSPQALALVRLLQVLGRPEDRISLVGLLRGCLFGHSDAELYRHFQGESSEVEQTMAFLEDLRTRTRDLPPAAILRQALTRTGLEWVDNPEFTGLVDTFDAYAEEGLTLSEICQEILETGKIAIPPTVGGEEGVRVMNLHRAKGLEARVVFLAAPASGLPVRVEHAVRRQGEQLRAAFCLRRKNRVLAQPLDWGQWESEELEFLHAEQVRLLYVATTRARDRLVVGQWSGSHASAICPWAPLDPYLEGVPRLQGEPLLSGDSPVPAPLTEEAALAWLRARDERHQQCREAGWSRHSVTANQHSERLETFVPPESREGPGGVAWGDLLHRLLEHLVRNPRLTRPELLRLARWFSFDQPDLTPHLEEALDLLDQLRQTPFWAGVLAAGQRLVEIPFGQRQENRFLFGTIDLALERQQGWDIVDYKSDRKSLEELVGSYAAQLQQYARSWQDITGTTVGYAGIYGLRSGQLSKDLQ